MLKFPIRIVEYEDQNQWNHAANYLVEDWRSNKEDLNKTLCAASELWFVLVFYEQLTFAGDIKWCDLQQQLDDVSDYAFQHYSHERLFKLFFGYMISAFPYLFSAPGKDEYEDAFDCNQQLGCAMCEQVYKSEPENIVAKLFSLRGGDFDVYLEIARKGADEIDRLFPDGESAVVDYFRGILS